MKLKERLNHPPTPDSTLPVHEIIEKPQPLFFFDEDGLFRSSDLDGKITFSPDCCGGPPDLSWF
jgi:hypothetical protein